MVDWEGKILIQFIMLYMNIVCMVRNYVVTLFVLHQITCQQNINADTKKNYKESTEQYYVALRSVFVLNFCRSQYFSPLDDLAFDMYQDPDVAQIIRKLERKKRDAVTSERYI